MILFREIGTDGVHIGWWLRNLFGRKGEDDDFFWYKKDPGVKIFHLQESLEQGSIRRQEWALDFSFVVWGLGLRRWSQPYDWRSTCKRVCWIGPNGSCYATTALLVRGDGEQWATAQTEIADAVSCPTLHLAETCEHTREDWRDWCCWSWSPKELNITLICIMSHWYGEALK